MCGIVGIVDLKGGRPVQAETLRAMASTMVHRGPDSDGVWIASSGDVGLAHRRLSIVDLSDAGRQPMATPDGRLQVSFNGEIYNYPELRPALEADGVRFRSDSDTEAILYLYQRHGAELVHHLDGDFGFGLWDEAEQRLLLARDPAGVKPVYYTVADGWFLFASEIKALLAHPAVTPELNERGLFDYLSYLVVPAPDTLFAGIHKLPAGSRLLLHPRDGGGPKVERYWEPFPGQMALEPDLDRQFEDLFRRSVEKRLMADVPVGVLFSGGVDSTLNAAMFGELIAPEQVHTFTVGQTGGRFMDEQSWAAEMAAHLGTRHHEITITEDDLLDQIDAIAGKQDEPLADPVCVPLAFVTRFARAEGMTVLHAGEGADEIFCGYDKYAQTLQRIRRLWNPVMAAPRPLRQLAYALARTRTSPRGMKIADVLRRAAKDQEFFLSSAIGYFEDEKATVLAPDFRKRAAGWDAFQAVAPMYERLRAHRPDATPLDTMTYIELQLRLPELLLMRVDKMAMGNTIEARVPFLDRRLIEFALSTPEAFRRRGGIGKEPVKRLAARYAPRDKIYRQKTGFGAPIQDWFATKLGDRMRAMLHDDREIWAAHFDVAELDRRLNRRPETANRAFQLWLVYNFMVWHRLYIQGKETP